jgi:hypothetical protein
MNENAKKWVDALLSGEFEQAKRRLRRQEPDGDRYCCLGVACEVYRRETGDGCWDGETFTAGGDRDNISLPFDVQAWLGLASDNGTSRHEAPLIDENDFGKDFKEIAAIIVAEPEGLFG